MVLLNIHIMLFLTDVKGGTVNQLVKMIARLYNIFIKGVIVLKTGEECRQRREYEEKN